MGRNGCAPRLFFVGFSFVKRAVLYADALRKSFATNHFMSDCLRFYDIFDKYGDYGLWDPIKV
jgi:hypothetical protein